MIPGKDPITQKSLNELRANDPVLIAREMMSFAAGVDWLLERWQKLRDNLEDDKFLHYPDKYEMCRMLGRRCEDSMIDPIVRNIMTCCNLAHPEAWNYNDEVIQASLAVEGKPSYAFLTERHAEKGPQTEEEAFTRLLTIMATEMVRLRALRETKLGPIDDLDREEATERAMFDDTKEAALALRYETEHRRALNRALEDYRKKRREDDKAAERLEDECFPRKTSTKRTAPPNEPKIAPAFIPQGYAEPRSTVEIGDSAPDFGLSRASLGPFASVK